MKFGKIAALVFSADVEPIFKTQDNARNDQVRAYPVCTAICIPRGRNGGKRPAYVATDPVDNRRDDWCTLRGDDIQSDRRPRDRRRITSYNVCYTKLLRAFGSARLDLFKHIR